MPEETAAPFRLNLAEAIDDRNCCVRIFHGDLDELAVELMTEGQRQPIKVRQAGAEYYVVDGHRRLRALARALQLTIAREGGRYMVYDRGTPLRESPRGVHPDYQPGTALCRRVDCGTIPAALLASQFLYNEGRPFSFLERSLFLSRLLRQGGCAGEALAGKLGFTPAQLSEARRLHPADPRLLEQVRLGRVSSPAALQLVRTFPAAEQIPRLKAAWAAAGGPRSESFLTGDCAWSEAVREDEGEAGAARRGGPADPVHARLDHLVTRLGGATQSFPNHAAEQRLATLFLIHRYVVGKIGYEWLEAHLLGRQ